MSTSPFRRSWARVAISSTRLNTTVSSCSFLFIGAPSCHQFGFLVRVSCTPYCQPPSLTMNGPVAACTEEFRKEHLDGVDDRRHAERQDGRQRGVRELEHDLQGGRVRRHERLAAHVPNV